MAQRLEKEYDIITCGYEPAYADRREPWIKCHGGEHLSRREALRQDTEEWQRKSPVA